MVNTCVFRLHVYWGYVCSENTSYSLHTYPQYNVWYLSDEFLVSVTYWGLLTAYTRILNTHPQYSLHTYPQYQKLSQFLVSVRWMFGICQMLSVSMVLFGFVLRIHRGIFGICQMYSQQTLLYWQYIYVSTHSFVLGAYLTATNNSRMYSQYKTKLVRCILNTKEWIERYIYISIQTSMLRIHSTDSKASMMYFQYKRRLLRCILNTKEWIEMEMYCQYKRVCWEYILQIPRLPQCIFNTKEDFYGVLSIQKSGLRWRCIVNTKECVENTSKYTIVSSQKISVLGYIFHISVLGSQHTYLLWWNM